MWQPTHVKVTVKQAKGLLTKGKNGTNNAFVVIGIGKEKYQTSIKDKALALNVDWREECELEIPSHGNTANLQLTLYHHNNLGIDEFLGQVSLPLNQFDVYEKPKYRYYPLKGKPEKEKKKGEKDRGELEVMVNFIVKSGSFLDVSKKDKQKSSTSLRGSLMSLGSKDNQSLKKFARSVGHKMDKITKPKRRKSKPSKETQGQSDFSGELMASQQRFGDADPGVISDEDDEFRFDEDIKVYTHSGSPHSSTLSRESSNVHDQILDDDVSSFASQESGQAYYGGKIPPPSKPPRIIDEVEETEPHFERRPVVIESVTVATAVAPSVSPIQEDPPLSPRVKVNVIPSSPEYLEAEPPSFLAQRSTSYEEAIYQPKKREGTLESVSESVMELPMHNSFESVQENSFLSGASTEFYSPNSDSEQLEGASKSPKAPMDEIFSRRKSANKKQSDIQRSYSGSRSDAPFTNRASAFDHSEEAELPQAPFLDDVDKDASFDSAHTRSASDGSSNFPSPTQSSGGAGKYGIPPTENFAKMYEPSQEDSGSFSTHLESGVKSSKGFLSKHDSNKPAIVKNRSSTTRSLASSNISDSIDSVPASPSEGKSKYITRSGSLNEKRSSDPIVDEWEQKLYGRSGITGSTENISMTGSRSSLNISLSSSTQDIRRDDSFTRMPEVKALSLDRKSDTSDYIDNKKPKKKGISAIKKRFFNSKGSGSLDFNESDSRFVEGGNDRVPSHPTRTSKLPQEIHDRYSGKSREDLMEMIMNLEGAVQNQVRHSSDLEEYIDNLLLRVMDATPHILQGI